jgi:hypothetical protein
MANAGCGSRFRQPEMLSGWARAMRRAHVIGGILLPLALGLAQAPKETTVSGMVVNSATGQPVSGALVVLTPGIRSDALGPNQNEDGDIAPARVRPPTTLPQPEPPKRVLTDVGGRFSFSVPAVVSAQLQITRRGFLSENGVDAASVFLNRDDLAKGEAVTVKLTPLGAVTGTVRNEDGEPLPSVGVQVMHTTIRNGRKAITHGLTDFTDDRGVYRLWYLAPGPAYLRVVGRQGTATLVGDFPQLPYSDHTYGPVYYPAATTLETAESVRIKPGETIHADFSVAARPAYKVRGILRNGRPDLRTNIRLLRGNDTMGNRILLNRSAESYEVDDVTPGAYVIQAWASAAGVSLFGETQVVVSDGDVPGVQIVMNTGVDVQGTVQLPAAGPGPAGRNFAVVQAIYNDPNRLPVGSGPISGRPDDSGNFTLHNLFPGSYTIQFSPASGYVQSAWIGSADVLAGGLTIGTDAPPDPLKIVVSPGGGVIEGVVEGFAQGAMTRVAFVRRYGSSILPFVGYVMPDGSFRQSNLAQGEYQIYAWPASREVEYFSAAALAGLARTPVSVSLEANAHERVTVKLAPEAER